MIAPFTVTLLASLTRFHALLTCLVVLPVVSLACPAFILNSWRRFRRPR